MALVMLGWAPVMGCHPGSLLVVLIMNFISRGSRRYAILREAGGKSDLSKGCVCMYACLHVCMYVEVSEYVNDAVQ